MPRTISAANFDDWADSGLSDFGDFSECVEYRNESPSGFGDSEGEWYYADEANLVLYYGTFGNDHSPGASHYTSADVYEPGETEDFRAAVQDWEDEPESLDEEEASVSCDSCNLVRINGLVCHETGCPDSWRGREVACFECGFDFPLTESRHERVCPNCRCVDA